MGGIQCNRSPPTTLTITESCFCSSHSFKSLCFLSHSPCRSVCRTIGLLLNPSSQMFVCMRDPSEVDNFPTPTSCVLPTHKTFVYMLNSPFLSPFFLFIFCYIFTLLSFLSYFSEYFFHFSSLFLIFICIVNSSQFFPSSFY